MERDAHFCEECGAPLGASMCPHCHHQIKPGLALCPHCGKPVNTAQCSYCGAAMEADDMFCEECGNPRGGISCPACGTLNFRSFCRQCNTPLNDMAAAAVRAAKADPRFRHAEQLAEEMAALAAKIKAAEAALAGGDTPEAAAPVEPQSLDTSSRLTEADRAALNRYATLFAGVGKVRPVAAPAAKPAAAKPVAAKPAPPKARAALRLAGDTLKAAVAEYQAKAAQLEAELNAMLPPATAPPETQRNFFSARKLRVGKMGAPQGWRCNYCGCLHRQPSECCEPQLGGHWVVDVKYSDHTTMI